MLYRSFYSLINILDQNLQGHLVERHNGFGEKRETRKIFRRTLLKSKEERTEAELYIVVESGQHGLFFTCKAIRETVYVF
jgi:hypothetical protein